MAYASRSGRASASSSNPRAFATCSRCRFWFNHDQLNFQYQYAGVGLQNLYILVCRKCTDVPQAQLKAIALPADPVPIQFPQVEPYLYDETLADTLGIATQNGFNIVGQPVGAPEGLEQYAISPMGVNPATGVYQAYGTSVQPLSVISDGVNTVTVTCSAAHGLSTNGQVSVSGLTEPMACGFFSVVANGAMSFSYTTTDIIPAGAMLTGTTRIVTVIVGLPRGYTTIPQV